MRAILLLLTVVAAPAVSIGQDTPVAVAVTPLGNGRVEVAITNRAHQPITGLTVVGEFFPLARGVTHITSARGIDSAVNPFDHPLMPNDTRSFVFGGPDPGPDKIRLEVSFKAAVF